VRNRPRVAVAGQGNILSRRALGRHSLPRRQSQEGNILFFREKVGSGYNVALDRARLQNVQKLGQKRAREERAIRARGKR